MIEAEDEDEETGVAVTLEGKDNVEGDEDNKEGELDSVAGDSKGGGTPGGRWLRP